MNKKDEKVTFLTKSVIYLLALLTVVMLYLLFIYPKFSAKINAINSEYSAVNTQIGLLAPYEYDMEKLTKSKAELDKAFDADTRLKKQVSFADLIINAADKSGFTLKSMTISSGTEESANKDEMQMYSADITLSGVNAPPTVFLKTLENSEGCGMYVTQINYNPSEADKAEFNVTVSMYTKEKPQ
ncbi:MAG: hypothetical protein RR087_09615 [Oscillospiraceae bacterium]